MGRHIHVIGIGAGDPDYVTMQAIGALNDTQVFFAMDKGEQKGDLVALRREICARFIREPGYRFVELPDPKRSTEPEYRGAVSDWHAARTRIWSTAIAEELGDDGVGAFLAWGDPSLYDSTLRILDAVAAEVEFTFDVIPGITAVQALTARHRIPLNEVGEPVLITTGRRLRAHGGFGSAGRSVVVLLDADCSFQMCPAGTRIWWGAYLGTEDELLVAGAVGEVGPRIVELRAEARARHGWIMDTYLLRTAD
ncbi:MAG: precorrin-6A synthase (deacetylating) [Mycobacterium sp.]|nr:precorrin-6A synthase (deacetylating) [Mycobacterium sp.]